MRRLRPAKLRDKGRKAGVPSARELKGDVRDAERKTKAGNKKRAASVRIASTARKKSGNSIAGAPKSAGNSEAGAPGGGGSGNGKGALSMQTLDKLAAFRSGVNEVALLEQVVLLQHKRVKSQGRAGDDLGLSAAQIYGARSTRSPSLAQRW